MIKNWKKFNEEFFFPDQEGDDELKPIGVDNMVEGTNGLVRIFSPLEYDMVEDWNSDETIQKWVEDKRVFLQEVKYDEWAIWGMEDDKEVKEYIMNNYSW